MKRLLQLSNIIDITNATLLRLVSWISLMMVLVQFLIVVIRYAFGAGFIPLQESVTYMYGILFLISAGGTFLTDNHVRIDIIYNQVSTKYQSWINLLGCIFLLIPFSILIFYTSWEYVIISWKILEGSQEIGGIRAVYLLKTTILIFAILIGIQGISQMIKSIHTIKEH